MDRKNSLFGKGGTGWIEKTPSLAKEGRGGSKKQAGSKKLILISFFGIIPYFTPHYIGIIPLFTPKNERKSPENLRNSLKISIFASDKAKDLC